MSKPSLACVNAGSDDHTYLTQSRTLASFRLAAACCGAMGMLAQTSLAQNQPAEASRTALTQPAALDLAAAVTPASQYAKNDTMWWSATVGVASDFDDIEDVNASIGFSYFAADDVEVGGDLLLRYIIQDGNDALGVNPYIFFRWHFLTSSTLLGMNADAAAGDRAWTMFLEAGIGPMFSTDDVPPPATSTNFTPRAGVGITAAISERTRLLASLRWSHVSNADILGNDNNVGSDGVMLTVGLIWAW